MLVLFFGLVMVCALFFSLGYTLGRKSEFGVTTAAAAVPQPAGVKAASSPAAAPAQSMTFYKSVEQKDANAQLTPVSQNAPDSSSTPSAAAPAAATPPAADSAQPATPTDSMAVPTSGYFVQVAAVSKEEDANALVDALKKKQYPAFVAPSSTADKLFHVQVGPFADVKDAEAMRSRLINDGYNPILKK